MIGQALDVRSATGVGSPASDTLSCRWTRRARRRRSTSPGGRTARRRRPPPRAIAGFDEEVAEEFFRAVANGGQAHPAPEGRGGDQRPPHGRGRVQGRRPRRCGRRSRSIPRDGVLDPPRGPCDCSLQTESSTTAWATCSVEKALEHVGAADDRRRPRRVRAADGVVLPGVGAFPRGHGSGPRTGPRRAGARARRQRACRCSGSAWGCSCCSTAPRSSGARGIGLSRVKSRPSTGDLKVPHIGWNPCAWRPRR